VIRRRASFGAKSAGSDLVGVLFRAACDGYM